MRCLKKIQECIPEGILGSPLTKMTSRRTLLLSLSATLVQTASLLHPLFGSIAYYPKWIPTWAIPPRFVKGIKSLRPRRWLKSWLVADGKCSEATLGPANSVTVHCCLAGFRILVLSSGIIYQPTMMGRLTRNGHYWQTNLWIWQIH